MAQRNSILCPNCRRLISKDVDRCPFCGLSRPGSRWKNNLWTRGLHQPDQMIRSIIYLNIGMFILSLLLNPRTAGPSFGLFSFFSPDQSSLFLLGATGTVPIAQYHRFWTLFSANYLHGGLLHIFFNMMALQQLAPLTLAEYGPYRMLVIYTLSGVGGYLLSYWAGIGFTIGASAAVCGLIGALLFYGRHRGGSYGRAVYSQIGGWAVGIFLFGFLVPGINNWAHGGGMLAGGLLGLLLGYQEQRQENLFHKILAAGCAAATLLALAWGILTAFAFLLLA